MTYKQLMLAAWEASTKAVLISTDANTPLTEEELAKLYNGLRGAKHEASTCGMAELDDYNLRCTNTPLGTRIEFELKRKVRDRQMKQNPEDFM